MTVLWFVLLALVAVRVDVWRKTKVAETAYPPEGKEILPSAKRVHFVQAGSGPDVVLIHGSMGTTRDMTFRLMPALTAAGFRVTAFDRPGLGYSQGRAWQMRSPSAQVDRLLEACDALGLERPIVVGQSLGGALALNWAVRAPERAAAIVSVSGATHPWKGPLDRSYQLLCLPIIGHIAALLAALFLSEKRLHKMVEDVFTPDEMPDGYIAHFGPALNMAPHRLRANALQRTLLRHYLRQQAPHYKDVSLPIEVIHGDTDATVGIDLHARPLVRDVQNGALTTLSGVGHMPHHTATPEVVAAIQRAALRAGLK